jgi:hypothetical protein
LEVCPIINSRNNTTAFYIVGCNVLVMQFL